MSYTSIDFTELEQRYATVESYVEKISTGDLRSLVVSGPAGVGKTYSIEQYLKNYSKTKYKVINGHMTLFCLYGHLYTMKDKGNVLVLDDIDTVLKDVQGLNILKAALDTKESRSINWQSTTRLLDAAGIPRQFNFNGSVILITNEGRGRFSGKLKNHYEALCDRTFHLKISSDSKESRLNQINFMIIKKNLLGQYNLSAEMVNDILDYINNNSEDISYLSLRTAIKAAELVKTFGSDWKNFAKEGLQDA
jgi:hypothetical protein